MDCPHCRSVRITRITYGTPPLSGAQLAKAIEDKTVVMGGCLLCEAEAPAFYCRDCGRKFGDARKPARLPRLFNRGGSAR